MMAQSWLGTLSPLLAKRRCDSISWQCLSKDSRCCKCFMVVLVLFRGNDTVKALNAHAVVSAI